MAQITVIYKDFNEMLAVARELLESASGAGAGKTISAGQASPADPQLTAAGAATVRQPEAQTQNTVPQVQSVTPQAQDPAPAAAAVPTSRPAYTMDDLSRAAMTLMDSGRMTDLQQLLASFGVSSLPDLPKEQYGTFATALRGMGAQI